MGTEKRIQVAVACGDYIIMRYGFNVFRGLGVLLLAARLLAIYRKARDRHG